MKLQNNLIFLSFILFLSCSNVNIENENKTMMEVLKEALTTGSFWTYPGIGIAIMLIIGFINRKANFSDKDDE